LSTCLFFISMCVYWLKMFVISLIAIVIPAIPNETAIPSIDAS
jgi:hypothetical protein